MLAIWFCILMLLFLVAVVWAGVTKTWPVFAGLLFAFLLFLVLGYAQFHGPLQAH